MKKLVTLLSLLLIGFSSLNAADNSPSLYDELVDVNKEWLKQNDVDPALKSMTANYSNREMLRVHLQLVEKTLRKRDVSHLSPELQEARKNNLDNLNTYWKSGAFPVNTTHSYRLPIFIDPFNNFCAVGALIKMDGHEEISRMISENGNFDYVHDMNYPELTKWASNSGLTVDELAWIQPAYSPLYTYTALKGGVNGNVNVITEDVPNGVIYAAGSFTQADGKPASNVAMWYNGFAGPDWMSISNDIIDGEVKAMIFHNGNLYIGGSFNHIGSMLAHGVAVWDGTQWQAMGAGFSGTVNDLIIYNGEIHAGGHFFSNSSNHFTHLAKWDDTNQEWVKVGGKFPIGEVNDLAIHNNELIIAGDFNALEVTISSIQLVSENIVAFDGTDYHDLGINGLPVAPVKAVVSHKGELYAGGDFTSPTAIPDTFGLAKFNGSYWENLIKPHAYAFNYFLPSSVNSLVSHDELIIGGKITYNAGLSGTYGKQLISYTENSFGGYFSGIGYADSVVNDMHLVNNQYLYVGGEFTNVLSAGSMTTVNHIAYTNLGPKSVGIDENILSDFNLYPNPSSEKIEIALENNTLPEDAYIVDFMGKKVNVQFVQEGNKLTANISALAAGTYVVQVKNNNTISSKKLIIRH